MRTEISKEVGVGDLRQRGAAKHIDRQSLATLEEATVEEQAVKAELKNRFKTVRKLLGAARGGCRLEGLREMSRKYRRAQGVEIEGKALVVQRKRK